MADQHPLPWRWEENGAGEESLVSADGWLLITAHDGVSTDSPYVRAVTERAGAMEVLLKRALAGIHATASERSIALDVMETADDIEDLLAEIDAAKAGG